MVQLWPILLIALLSAIVVCGVLAYNRKEMKRRLKQPRVYVKPGVTMDGKSIVTVLEAWEVKLTGSRAAARFIIEYVIENNKRAVALGIWSSSNQLLLTVSFSDKDYRVEKIPFLLFRAMNIAMRSMEMGEGKKYTL